MLEQMERHEVSTGDTESGLLMFNGFIHRSGVRRGLVDLHLSVSGLNRSQIK